MHKVLLIITTVVIYELTSKDIGHFDHLQLSQHWCHGHTYAQHIKETRGFLFGDDHDDGLQPVIICLQTHYLAFEVHSNRGNL